MKNPKGLVDAISDSAYAHPIDTAAKIHAMKSKSQVENKLFCTPNVITLGLC